MVDSRKDDHGGQTFLAQLLQGIVNGTESRLEGLDDAVVLVVRTLRDQAPNVVEEEVVMVS